MTRLRGPNDRIPLGRILLRLDPLTTAESDRVRDMLAQLGPEEVPFRPCGAWQPPRRGTGRPYRCTRHEHRRGRHQALIDGRLVAEWPPRRSLRAMLGLAAGTVAVVMMLACTGSGSDPGRPKCVDDKGRTTTCPEEWHAR